MVYSLPEQEKFLDASASSSGFLTPTWDEKSSDAATIAGGREDAAAATHLAPLTALSTRVPNRATRSSSTHTRASPRGLDRAPSVTVTRSGSGATRAPSPTVARSASRGTTYASGGKANADETYTTRPSGARRRPNVPPPYTSSAPPPPRPWYKRAKPLSWFLLVCIAIILGVVLGVHFGLKAANRVDDADIFDLPGYSLPRNQTGLEEVGSYYTSGSYSSSIDSVFDWTAGGVTLTSSSSSSSSSAANADLIVNLSSVQQQMQGFGAALTDSSCYLLHSLKQSNETDYDEVMDYIFNNRTGMSMIRVPIGSSDYSNQGEYNYAETAANTFVSVGNLTGALSDFSLSKAESYVIPVLQDTFARRPDMKMWLSPWSPPAWMKTSNSMNGGQLIGGYEQVYALYLSMTVAAYTSYGLRPWAITVQNEGSRGDATYPTNWMSATQYAVVAGYLRTYLNDAGYSDVRIYSNDDNWSTYENVIDAYSTNASAFDGVAWHCYDGSASNLTQFTSFMASNSTLSKVEYDMHMTECTTTDSSTNQWYSVDYWLQDFYFGSINLGVSSFMAWNLVLDSSDGPRISTAPCDDCLGMYEITSPSNVLKQVITATNAQFITGSHFAAATNNLTAYGGGANWRVAADLTSSASSTIKDCITGYSAFVSPWNSTSIVTSSSEHLNRVGLVLENSCLDQDVTVKVGFEPSGQVGEWKVKSGVVTFIVNI